MAKSGRKEGDSEDEHISQKVQPQSQPPLNGYSHIISSVFKIQPPFRVFNSSVLMVKNQNKEDIHMKTDLFTICSDSGKAR